MSKLDTPVIKLVDGLGEWSTTVPERAEGQFIWQRVKYINADGSVEYSEPVCLTGDKGEQGIAGVGEDGKTTYLHIKYSNDGGKTFTSNNGEDVGEYMGQCTDFNIDDPTTVSSYKWSLIKGSDGQDGQDGKDGRDGKDAITYQIESSLGTQFLEGNEQYTTLTAKIYKGTTELDSAGAYGYEWYLVKDGAEPVHIGNGKTVSLLTTTLGGNGIYFEADDGGAVEELPQLDTPSIQLVEVFNKLDTPNIYLENDEINKLKKPNIYLDVANLGKLEKPNIELKEE